MDLIHTAVADPDSTVATRAFRNEHHTLGLRLLVDPETGRISIDEASEEDLPDDYHDLLELVQEYDLNTEGTADELRERVQEYRSDALAERVVEAYDDIVPEDETDD